MDRSVRAYGRERLRRSGRLHLTRDFGIAVVAGAVSWLFLGSDGARSNWLSLGVGLLSAALFEGVSFAYRFTWTVPLDQYREDRKTINRLENHREIQQLADQRALPKTATTFRLSKGRLRLDISNAGHAADFWGLISTEGLGQEPDFSGSPAIWVHDASNGKVRIVTGMAASLDLAFLHRDNGGPDRRWLVFARALMGVEQSRSPQIEETQASPRFEIIVTVHSDPEAQSCGIRRSVEIIGENVVDLESGRAVSEIP